MRYILGAIVYSSGGPDPWPIASHREVCYLLAVAAGMVSHLVVSLRVYHLSAGFPVAVGANLR